jgi:hypothetical protein
MTMKGTVILKFFLTDLTGEHHLLVSGIAWVVEIHKKKR